MQITPIYEIHGNVFCNKKLYVVILLPSTVLMRNENTAKAEVKVKGPLSFTSMTKGPR